MLTKNTTLRKDEPHTFTLSNGMKCVCAQPSGRVGYCGVIIGAGSRMEPEGADGLAHFVEHTIFKGTHRRKSWHISNRMESVGGELNAYTTKEETVIYTTAPAGYGLRSLDLLADLICESTFPSRELDKEREVVIDEINSYLDNPGESVFDEYEELIYAGSRMAHNILGTANSVRSLNSNDCLEFVTKHYTPADMTLYVVDSLPTRTIERAAENLFGHLTRTYNNEKMPIPPINLPFSEIRNKGGHQAHTVVGTRIFGRYDERRYAMFLLNNYLGGPCMNSRFNQELRDKRGYVYTVDSSLALMSDCGTWQVYFGSDPSDADKCIRLITKEVERLAEKALTQSTFDKIKRQYVGQLNVGSDQRESAAMSLGKSLHYYGEAYGSEYVRRRIEEVSAEELRDVARLIMERSLSRLTLM